MSGISIGASFGGAMREENLTPIASMAMQRVNFPDGIDDDTASAMIPHIVGHRGAKITVAGATSNTTLKLKVASSASQSYISVAGQNVLRANHGARLAQQLIDDAHQNVLLKQKVAKSQRTSASTAQPTASSKQPAASKGRNRVHAVVSATPVPQPVPIRKCVNSIKPPPRTAPRLTHAPIVQNASPVSTSETPRNPSTTNASPPQEMTPKKRLRQQEPNVIEILDTPTRTPTSPPPRPEQNKSKAPQAIVKLSLSSGGVPNSSAQNVSKRETPKTISTVSSKDLSIATNAVPSTCPLDGTLSHYNKSHDAVTAASLPVLHATTPQPQGAATHVAQAMQSSTPSKSSEPFVLGKLPSPSESPTPSSLPSSALVAWTSTLQSSVADIARLGSAYAKLRKEFRAAKRQKRLADARMRHLVAIQALAAHVPLPTATTWHSAANEDLLKIQRRMQRDHLRKRCPSSLLLPAFVRVALVVPMPAPRLCNALVLMHDQLLPHPFQCLDDSFPDMSDLSKAELLHSMQPNADLEETCHLHETMVASAASTATNIHEFGLYAVHISYVLRRIVLHRAASKEWLYRGYGQHVPLESNANAWQESFESWRNTVMEAVLPSALSRECHPLVQRTCDFYPYLLPSVLQWTSDMQARGEAKDDSATVLQPLLDKVTSLLLSCKMPFPRLVEHERLLQQHVKALLVALAQQQVTEWAQLLKAHADLRELVETGFDDDGVAGLYLLPGYEHPPQQLCDDNIPPCQTLPALAALAHQQVRLSRRKA